MDATPTTTVRRRALAGVVSLAALVTSAAMQERRAEASEVDSEAVAAVNAYRAMSGLEPVTLDPTWSAEATAHSCYMLANGLAHDELPGRPGYTAGGDLAGNSGNVAMSSSATAGPRDHVDLWMTGPFHAIGILRPQLRVTGYGQCAGPAPTESASAATLDVLRGIDAGAPAPDRPVVFPGDGAVVPLYRFVAESPNPVSLCGWTGEAGLPLLVLFPDAVAAADATLAGPDGPIETCVLHAGQAGGDALAEALLAASNAVIVVPRVPLGDGGYTASVATPQAATTWSFDVDRDALLGAATAPAVDTRPLGPLTRFDAVAPFRLADSRLGQPVTRLVAGSVTAVSVADPDVSAVSANFVAVAPDDRGYLTLYDCGTDRPTVSSVAFGPRGVVATAAIVPLQDGKLCVYSKATTDIVIDVNGYFSDDGGAGFVAVEPFRVYDSRTTQRLAAGEVRAVTVPSDSSPDATRAVVLSAVAIDPVDSGYLRVYPCGAPSGAEISSINYAAHGVVPNVIITPTDQHGRVCVQSLREVDVVLDVTGYFVEGAGRPFQPLAPIRLLDTRVADPALNPLTGGVTVGAGETVRLRVAGVRGVPAAAAAVSVNVTATGADAAGFVTVFPCGARPGTSAVNVDPSAPASANAALVKLSADGDLCLFSRAAAHLVVDINGAWL